MTQVNEDNPLLQVTDASFEREVLRSDRPVLVAFWASWNLPSATIIDLLGALAPCFKDQLKLALVNVDEAPMCTSHYALTTLPTLCVMADGKLVESQAGLLDRVSLREVLDRASGQTPIDSQDL